VAGILPAVEPGILPGGKTDSLLIRPPDRIKMDDRKRHMLRKNRDILRPLRFFAANSFPGL
jgi:hypothetical protein